MFSLWVCPDCRRVGSRVSVRPGTASPACACGSESGTPGQAPTPVNITEWLCRECGQVGTLIEHREQSRHAPPPRCPETQPDNPEATRFMLATCTMILITTIWIVHEIASRT